MPHPRLMGYSVSEPACHIPLSESSILNWSLGDTFSFCFFLKNFLLPSYCEKINVNQTVRDPTSNCNPFVGLSVWSCFRFSVKNGCFLASWELFLYFFDREGRYQRTIAISHYLLIVSFCRNVPGGNWRCQLTSLLLRMFYHGCDGLLLTVHVSCATLSLHYSMIGLLPPRLLHVTSHAVTVGLHLITVINSNTFWNNWYFVIKKQSINVRYV